MSEKVSRKDAFSGSGWLHGTGLLLKRDLQGTYVCFGSTAAVHHLTSPTAGFGQERSFARLVFCLIQSQQSLRIGAYRSREIRRPVTVGTVPTRDYLLPQM